MNKILAKINKDFLFIFMLLLIYFIGSICLGHIYGDLYVDCGREAYLPLLVLKGKVLYKDVFAMYNPLSYQINALLYIIFGSSIKTLYGAAYVNGFLIIAGIYFICRRFINQYYSFVICFLLMSFYVLGSVNLCSYLFPYAYAFPYAAACFTYSVLFCILYMEKDKRSFLYLSALMLGFSFANKPEFAICIIPIAVLLFMKKEKSDAILYTSALFILPTIISYGILFLQGLSLRDFTDYLKFIYRFFQTEEQKYYLKIYLPFDWKIWITIFKNAIFFSVYCFISIIYFKLNKNKIAMLLLLPVYIIFCFNFLNIYNTNSAYNIFCWITIPAFIILCSIIRKTKNIKDKMLVFLFTAGLLSAWRLFFVPFTKSISIFILLPVVSTWIYFIKTEWKFSENYKKYISAAFIILSLLNIWQVKINTLKLEKIPVSNSDIHTFKNHAIVFNALENWINKNTKKEDSVLVLPDGVMLNFVTERPTKTMYYHLIPNHISALGETNIVDGLSNDKPDYIILTNLNYKLFGASFICKDFGFEICNFINNHYEPIVEFPKYNKNEKFFKAKIYKLK